MSVTNEVQTKRKLWVPDNIDSHGGYLMEIAIRMKNSVDIMNPQEKRQEQSKLG